MDLRQIRYFVTVAETGSISAAAARLALSQPSLSEMLARLEDALMVQLLIRGNRGIQLTDAGRLFANRGQAIIESVDQALTDVAQLGGEAKGSVVIGFPPSIALLLSVPLAETVRQELPDVKLRIAESMSGYVLNWVEEEHIDIGIVYQGLNCAHLDVKPLLKEELFLVTAPDNWAASPPSDGPLLAPVEFASLAQIPLVLPSRLHGLRELIERYAKAQNVQLDVALEIDALRHIVSIVSRASAHTILSHAAVMEEVVRGELKLVPIANPKMQRTAYVVRKPGREVSAASLAVEKLLGTILSELIQRHDLVASLA
ncbi:LysR family transcriptional regulator [Bosea sp. ASV33]|uniref:LysR substrate-binding domain-containing protein n=1 Tax=Bosea sp. ASV33 TaxID=2795106 RepID=UPI0018ECE5E6